MYRTTMKHSLLMVVCALFSQAICAQLPTVTTTINLNGALTRVYFNDGDTFKVLGGRLAQKSARVVGINSLETYGPVHEFAGSSPDYLLEMSYQATIMAQHGEWSCTTDQNKDIYGRLLVTCDDLALALIKAGLAHAYSVDNKAASGNYLMAQNDAQNQQKGIWKFGVPDYIITSLHSAGEGESKPYNRLSDTIDGHSEIWYHHDEYDVCQKVCLDDGSCMIYVPYTRRFGDNRAECLLP